MFNLKEADIVIKQNYYIEIFYVKIRLTEYLLKL